MKLIWVLLAMVVAGCAAGGSKGPGGWAGQPVLALDTHRYFQTLPMIKTYAADGAEMRTYQSRANTYQCYTEGGVRAGLSLSQNGYDQVMACTAKSTGCDYTFSVRDGKVLTYAPSGRIFDAGSCAAAAAGTLGATRP